jgi:hypothetical protein
MNGRSGINVDGCMDLLMDICLMMDLLMNVDGYMRLDECMD